MRNTKDTVIHLIAELMGVPSESVNPTDNLVDDLGSDSLHLIEILMGLEEEFDIEISDEEFGDNIKTVQDIIDFVSPTT